MKVCQRIIMLYLLVFIATGIIYADGLSFEKDISMTLSSKYWSEYISSNTGGVVHKKPVLQTDLFVSLPKGFYFDFWNSAGLDGTNLNSDYGDEIDYTLGWKGRVKKINLDLGVSYFDLYRLFKGPKGDLIYPYVELSKDFKISDAHTLSPFVCFKFPYSAKGDERGHGMHTHLGFKHDWKINPKLGFCQKINLLFDDGACGFDSGVLGQYQCSLTWQISKSFSVDMISVKAATPMTSLRDKREAAIAYGWGATYHF